MRYVVTSKEPLNSQLRTPDWKEAHLRAKSLATLFGRVTVISLFDDGVISSIDVIIPPVEEKQ